MPLFKDDGLGALGNQLVGAGLGAIQKGLGLQDNPTVRATNSGTDTVKRQEAAKWNWKIVAWVAAGVVALVAVLLTITRRR